MAKGPPARVAFDADGNPTKAAEGFAKRNGIDVSELRREEIDGGEYVTATVRNEGQAATVVLQEALPQLLSDIKFGKNMRWNSDGIAFSRPIRWLVALYDDIVIPFQYAGVVAGNTTRGLRPYGSPEITVANPDEYIGTMAEQNIFLNRDERREIVIDQITGLAEKVGGAIPDDPDLLDEVTNLIEAPMAFMGNFEEKYLELPRDVLITVMRKHQRYFPVLDDDGNLLPHFIGVRNGDQEHLDKVIKGNEHVIRARFSDADYFYRQDIRKPLEDYLPRLDTLVFHDKLGSMLEKNRRVAGLIETIADKLGMSATDITTAQEAATILKADLATQMVVEMTSLQGAMGREYALKEGKSEAVANAIFEHWQPRSVSDSIPASNAGTILAIADKLDSLVGLFAAGLAPRSTSDPFGLRRAALGIVQILVGKKVDVNLRDLIREAAAAQPIDLDRKTFDQLLDFIKGRLDVWLEEEIGAPRDVINAVLAEQFTNPYRTYVGIQQLQDWVQKEKWETILDNFARCVRISRKEPVTHAVDSDLFEDEKEATLYKMVQDAQEEMGNGNVEAFLSAFEPVVPVIFDYFETIMVNAEDDNIRKNRLGMMQMISNLQNGRADLSELAGF